MQFMNLFETSKDNKAIQHEYNNTHFVLPPAPKQDDFGNIIFIVEGNAYTLNVNSEEERERVKELVNHNSEHFWDWFLEPAKKDTEGFNGHWVFYDTEMYEVNTDYNYLHYKEESNLTPTMPINATTCQYMFSACRTLTTLDLSRFNTSGIISMCYMFDGCNKLQELDVSHFRTNEVVDMESIFSCCSSLSSLDISNFDTSSVKSMKCMFDGCQGLTTLILGKIKTDQVYNMSYMFASCCSLEELNLNEFYTSNLVDAEGMFSNCRKLKTLDLSYFETENLMTMRDMFALCTSITKIDFGMSFITNNVRDMHGAFRECHSLVYLSPGFYNTESVTDFSCMFLRCISLVLLDLRGISFEYTSIPDDAEDMLSECDSLKFVLANSYGLERYLEEYYPNIELNPEESVYKEVLANSKPKSPEEVWNL